MATPVRMLIATLVIPLTGAHVPQAPSSKALGPRSQAGTSRIDVVEASITDLQRAMSDGRATSVELVDAYLARIAAYDHAGPAINAMIRLNPRAREDAAALDAERKAGRVRGPLHGIPIVLKDNYDTRDLVTSAGSLALATHRPRADAFVVGKLREAGAVILGKTNMHELAAGITSVSSLGGQTRNPYDLSRCPGGSSGGTGAAIAASFAAVGWGSDTCGSIRIPSAFGSLFGLRPTQGLFSRSGIVPLSHTQDTPGPLARTVTDLAIGLDATVGADSSDPATKASAGKPAPAFRDSLRRDALRGARIGIFAPYFRNADGDVADTIRAAARSMRALGAEVIEVNMPDFDTLIGGSSAILLESKFDLMDYLARPGGAPVRSLREIIDKGLYDLALEDRHKTADTVSTRDGESHQKVLAKQALVRQRIIALLDSLKLDAIAYPTMVRKPVLAGDPQLGSTCALSAHTGLPAISMPAGFTADGLPAGLELLGRPFSDARLVAFAFAFEQGFPRRRPPTSTPALVNGRAPKSVTFSASTGLAASAIRGRFTFDPTTSQLAYAVLAAPAMASTIQAAVIRRSDATGARVIRRVLGPAMTSGSGQVRLAGLDLGAFRAGRMSLAVFTSDGAQPAAELPIVSPELAQSARADLILVNGHIITVDARDDIVRAVALAGNKILAVGSDAEISRLAGPNTQRIDLHGLTVTPGLIDAHAHFNGGGADRLFVLDLSYPNVKSVADVVAAVAAKAAQMPAGTFIEGRGWDEGKLAEKRMLTARDLDAAAPGNPVYLVQTTGHYGVANSAALRLAGITKDTPDPPAGTIDRYADGSPTGILKEGAAGLVSRLAPRRTAEQTEQGMRELAQAFNEEGMTALKDPGVSPAAWDSYRKVLGEGALTVRVFALWLGGRTADGARRLIAQRAATSRPYESTGDDHLISGGVKLYIDGSGGARTAWLYDDWNREYTGVDVGNTGYPTTSPDTIRTLIKMFHNSGMHVAVHSIGDRGIDWTVDSFVEAMRDHPIPGLRHAIIHANIPTDRAIDAMARLQKTFDAGYPEPSASFHWWLGDTYAGNFGPQRALRLNPFRTYLSKGMIWANGSDYGVTPFPARYGLWAAVARQPLLGVYGNDPFGRKEVVDVHAALRAVTIWAAHQLFLEKRIGSLEPGKYADLAVWDRDPYAVPTADLKDMRCQLTIFNGKIVFRAPNATLDVSGGR